MWMPTISSVHLHCVGNPIPDPDECDGCAAGDNPAAATTSKRSVSDNARPSYKTPIISSYFYYSPLHMELVVRLVRMANEVLLVYPA
jgi:hypothetical protein